MENKRIFEYSCLGLKMMVCFKRQNQNTSRFGASGDEEEEEKLKLYKIDSANYGRLKNTKFTQ